MIILFTTFPIGHISTTIVKTIKIFVHLFGFSSFLVKNIPKTFFFLEGGKKKKGKKRMDSIVFSIKIFNNSSLLV